MYKKNPPNWSPQSMLDDLKIFDKIYENRPIKNNHEGMRFPHMFAMYYMLKKIKPDFVVESGIFKGQSTWLIEKTLPEAKILSIDIDLNQREYISKSKNVIYSSADFINHDYSDLSDNSLVFLMIIKMLWKEYLQHILLVLSILYLKTITLNYKETAIL
jgi:hypothetical protein